jgi:hypothetical protein
VAAKNRVQIFMVLVASSGDARLVLDDEIMS